MGLPFISASNEPGGCLQTFGDKKLQWIFKVVNQISPAKFVRLVK